LNAVGQKSVWGCGGYLSPPGFCFMVKTVLEAKHAKKKKKAQMRNITKSLVEVQQHTKNDTFSSKKEKKKSAPFFEYSWIIWNGSA